MNWLGILVFFAVVGVVMVAAWLCRLAEAKPPIDPTIGFRDPERDYWNCFARDIPTHRRRLRGANVAKPVQSQRMAATPRIDGAPIRRAGGIRRTAQSSRDADRPNARSACAGGSG